MGSQHARLFISRFNKTISNAAMLSAFTQSKNARIRCCHVIIDKNAARSSQARCLGKFNMGANADRHDNKISFDLCPISKLNGFDAIFAVDHFCLRRQVKGNTACRNIVTQHGGCFTIELALHQSVHQMDYVCGHISFCQSISGFKPKQAPANHDSRSFGSYSCPHFFNICQIAEGDHALKISARQRQHDWLGAGGNNQQIIGEWCAACEGERF